MPRLPPLLLILLHVAQGYEYQLIDAGMRAIASQLQAGAFANSSLTYNRLAYATTVFGPRFSGTQNLENALDWIRDTARNEDGLTVIEEPVSVPVWVRGTEYINMISAYRNTSLHMLGLGMSNGTMGEEIEAAVLVVHSQQELIDRAAGAVGKIVVFNVPFTTYGQTVQYRAACGVWAAQVGAVAAIVRSIAPYGIQTPHTGGTITATIPAAAISIEDANMLDRLTNQYGMTVTLQMRMDAHFLPDAPSRNLILELPGSEQPDQFVVIGGHSDSWDIAAGAMDDGGGIFTAWEAVRLIKTLGIPIKRSIRAVMWVNEENGARGGSAYAQDYNYTLPNTSMVIECDEGAFTPYGMSFSGHPAAYNQLLLLAPLLQSLGAGNVSFIPGARGTDIAPMCNAGVPCAGMDVLDPRVTPYANNPCMPYVQTSGIGTAGQISDGYFWYHHTAGDTIERMDPIQLQSVAAAFAIWAVTIANLPELLPRSGDTPPMPGTPNGAPVSPGAVVGIVFGIACVVSVGGYSYYRLRLRAKRRSGASNYAPLTIPTSSSSALQPPVGGRDAVRLGYSHDY